MTEKKAKQEAKTDKSKGRFVKTETTVILTLVALVFGFLAGEIIDFSRRDRSMPVPPAQMPAPVPQQSRGIPPGPTLEQIESIRDLEEQVSSNPGSVEAWTQLGNTYFDSNQVEKAIRAYKKSLDLSPYDADVWTDLGVMYRRRKQPVEAVGAFNKAIDVDPGHEVARMNKGIVLFHDMGDREGAAEAWEGLLKVNPEAKMGDGQPVSEVVQKLKQMNSPEKNPS